MRSRSYLGGALALVLPAVAAAQDGRPPVGAPVTNRGTNAEKVLPTTSTPPAGNTSQVLTGVPATGTDPAPIGTRAVPADASSAPRQAGEAAAKPGAAVKGVSKPVQVSPGIMLVEGVVTKIDTPDKGIAGSKLSLTIDPAQSWEMHVGGPATIATRAEVKPDAAKPADASPATPDAPAPADPNAPQPVTVVTTIQTRMVGFARSADGVDLIGAPTLSASKDTSTASGLTHKSIAASSGPAEINFTSIREGSFVAVRYRKIGAKYVATNLSLIEPPLSESAPKTGTGLGSSGTPGGIGTPSNADAATRPGDLAPAAGSTRVLTIPNNTVGTGSSPR